MPSRRGARFLALAACFAGTGAAGLLAEQAFEKLLGTLLGTSTSAQATVLAAYFGGLTLGAWLYTRWRGARRPLAAYAALEAVIALSCVALALACDRLVPAFAPLLRLGAGRPGALLALRLVAAAIWILPVTVPMGATFPAIVDALDAVPERARRPAVQAFYGLNLAGAVAGAALGPHVLFPRLAFDGALYLAAALDGVAAAVAATAARGLPVLMARAERATADHALRRELPLLAAAATSGFLLFALEVVWSHLIGTVIGSSAYSFATMLALVLAGLGIGSILAGAVSARFGNTPPALPGAALVLVALLLAMTHDRWPRAPHAVALAGPIAFTFADAEQARAAVATSLLLAPTVVLGTVYPMLLRLEAFPRVVGGATAARMGAVNAIGCIAGALLAGLVLVPRLGSDRALRALAALSAAAGAAILVAYVRSRARLVGVAACAGVLTFVLALPPWDKLLVTSGEHVYLRRAFVHPTTKLRFFHEDTAGGFTTVVENERGGARARCLLTNGKFQGDDAGEMPAQDGFALAPMQLLHAYRRALVIGLGTGRSAHVVAAMGFDAITIAEIAPGIVEAARREFSHINGGIVDRPNVRIIVEDGRNLLLLDEGTYDLVTMEVSSVWFSNETNLYAREFYQLARARLRPGGVMQQWIQLHHLSHGELLTILATFRAIFPKVSLFVAGRQGVLVGGDGPHAVSAEYLDRLAAHAREIGVGDPADRAAHLAASRLLGPEDVDALVTATRPILNTDRNRLLEWTTPRYGHERVDRFQENLAWLASASTFQPMPVEEGASGAAAAAVLRVDPAAIRRTVGLR